MVTRLVVVTEEVLGEAEPAEIVSDADLGVQSLLEVECLTVAFLSLQGFVPEPGPETGSVLTHLLCVRHARLRRHV